MKEGLFFFSSVVIIIVSFLCLCLLSQRIRNHISSMPYLACPRFNLVHKDEAIYFI